jgi:hypothetical protein
MNTSASRPFLPDPRETQVRALTDFAEVCRRLAVSKNVFAAEALSGANPRVTAALQAKAAVTAGGSASDVDALVPFQQLADAFLASLRQSSVFDWMLPAMRNFPLNVRMSVASSGFTASEVAPGAAILVRRMAFASSTLTPTKVAAIVALSQELSPRPLR